MSKTNAMRLLDSLNIDYKYMDYDSRDNKIDGISVAKKIGRSPEEVFKTLVAQGNSGDIYVFIIPVDKELDLKKAAKAAREKKIDMIKATIKISKFWNLINCNKNILPKPIKLFFTIKI